MEVENKTTYLVEPFRKDQEAGQRSGSDPMRAPQSNPSTARSVAEVDPSADSGEGER